MTKCESHSRKERIMQGAANYAAYYRANPHRFAADYLHLELKFFQKVLIIMMNLCTVVTFIGSRGKVFIASPHSNVRAIIGQNR